MESKDPGYLHSVSNLDLDSSFGLKKGDNLGS